jgi:ABC-type phosphate/phosphonate transport system permease subunit
MIKTVFQKLWTAVVAATTGAVLGIVVAIILAQQHISPVDANLIAVWSFAGIGFMASLILGGRKKASPTN